MSDRITLTGLAVTACHGVLDFEKRIPQPFVLDISLEADLGPAGRSDELEASLSYADVAARAIEVCSGEPVDLIETLAERVADACLAWEIVEAVDVTVHKPHAPAGVAFTPSTGVLAGPSVSVRREQRRRVVVAMGTNLGRRVATLRAALDSLRALEGFEVTQVSPLVETDPVGGVAQPDYLNAVVVGVTRLAPGHLIRELHRIEADHGRVRGERWGARTLDLDVVTLGEAGREDEIVLADERDGVQAGAADASWSPLALPHPRAHERAFVLVPWAQAAPWMAVRTPDGVLPLLDAVQRVDASGVRRGPSWDDDDHIDLEEGLT
ncbi:2-amino-4-hydroxy-6-hydroxymethyldihydropteridine diphosphokinase [Dermacoccus nishinomiyaensis]|uniref:2-amino-4-hydroxy-6- hydroxymethyldihydropteridine diphosphokinase n=1 Tax=Dermacoccus nishinomiyaensis TaxID=1274 RepID=UPI0033B12FE5